MRSSWKHQLERVHRARGIHGGKENKKKKRSKQSSWKDIEEALMSLKPKTRV